MTTKAILNNQKQSAFSFEKTKAVVLSFFEPIIDRDFELNEHIINLFSFSLKNRRLKRKNIIALISNATCFNQGALIQYTYIADI